MNRSRERQVSFHGYSCSNGMKKDACSTLLHQVMESFPVQVLVVGHLKEFEKYPASQDQSCSHHPTLVWEHKMKRENVSVVQHMTPSLRKPVSRVNSPVARPACGWC